MSSPPTSNTSVKAAHLHDNPRRSSSFPPLAVLNPFRKKSRPARSPSPIEPYEVAPGIWNTDATAKVFGYLEPVAKRGKSGGHVARSDNRWKSQIPEENSVVEKDSPGLRLKTRNNDLIEDLLHIAQPTEHLRGRLEKVHAKRVGERYQSKVESERMRTVSRDDQLIQRGANPRTGLVSPLVVSDNSDENLEHDYVSFSKMQSDRSFPNRRVRSGKWKQDGVGWSLVESPRLSPIPQSLADSISRRVSCKELEDKFLVEMPGVDNPEPKNMTEQQMRRYQDSVARGCRYRGIKTMIDPNTLLPSPRPSSPEGPSTPPNKLQRIRRKMVGSGPIRRADCNGTVIVAEKRATSMPTPRKSNKESPRVRAVTPSRSPKVSSPELYADKSVIAREDAFLDQRNRRHPGQAASGPQSPSLRTRRGQEAHHPFAAGYQSPVQATFVEPAATLTLSHCLPRLQLLHPSHFANLETSSYRRPAQLLPARLRSLEQRRKTIGNACTITTTSTLSQRKEKGQRPVMQRQDGSIVVPRAMQRSPLERGKSAEVLLPRSIPMKKRSSAIRLMVDTSELTTVRSNAPGPAVLLQDLERTQLGSMATVPEAEQGARAAMLRNCSNHRVKNNQMKSSGGFPRTQGPRLGSANIIPDHVQGDQRKGDGITLMSGHLGDSAHGRDQECWNSEQEQPAEVRRRAQQQPSTVEKMALRHDSRGWFAGHWAERQQDQRRTDCVSLQQKDLPARKWSILEAAANASPWMPARHRLLQASAKLEWFQMCMYEMACHTTQTLHPNSPAMTLLRTPNKKTSNYLQAAKDLILACAYLLLLLNVLVALKKVLVVLSLIIYWFWHPMRLIFANVKYVLA